MDAEAGGEAVTMLVPHQGDGLENEGETRRGRRSGSRMSCQEMKKAQVAMSNGKSRIWGAKMP